MALCLAARCPQRQNPDNAQYCQACGQPLLLQSRYRPLQAIAKGGFGYTFLAEDTQRPSHPLCVIKQLRPSPQGQSVEQWLQLFRQEALQLERLHPHPQIPTLLAYFELNQQFYLVQDYVEGWTLAQEVQRQGPLSEVAVREVLEGGATILAFIHGRRVIHRDLKPSNLMRRQSDRSLVLIDFGIAKTLDSTTQAVTGTVIGSPEYMAPEQLRGKALPASDLFGLGLSAIALLTGRSPLDCHDPIRDHWSWREALPDGTEISAKLGAILDQLIAPSLGRRYATAIDLKADLEQLDSPERPVWQRPGGIVYHPRQQKRRLPIASPANALASPAATNIVPELDWADYLTEVDYRTLREYLDQERWQAADAETWACLATALGHQRGEYLAVSSLSKLGRGDLELVDVLWRKYSGGRFGFTPQIEIFQGVDPTFRR